MKLLIDVSSVMWMSLLAGKDKEFGQEVEHEGKTVQVNGWQFGYDNAVNHITSVMKVLDLVPIDLIFVVEGEYAKSKRKVIYSGYKEERGSRPPEAYVEFGKAREALTTAFRNVGAQSVSQVGVEADDLLAYLARNIEGEIVILTNDGDMTTLIDERVSLWQAGVLTKRNKYGPFPHKYVPVYKALVGDGNEYKGAAGFGPKAFLDMLVWLGNDSGLAALEGMMRRRELGELEEDVAEFKPLRKVIDGAEHVYESYQCALLHDEWCNTMRQPLVWKAGMVRGKDVVTDSRLQQWAQSVHLCTAATYEHIGARLLKDLMNSPCVGLDIETSTPDESDDWLAQGGRESKVDVRGSKITGCSLTVGRNNNRTIYFPIDHAETDNVTSEQVRQLVEAIPTTTPIIIHNFGGFEGPILYAEWGEAMKDNGWHGFLPNVIDSAICASYVNENISMGLKQCSKHYLDYEQVSYADVTTVDGEQRKMNQLTGAHVLNYGADDTICSVAIYNHFKIRQDLEKTWGVMMEVEQLPAYVTALAFHQGANFSLQRMQELQKEDAATYAEKWAELRDYLIKSGWEGTVTPHYTELTPAAIKESCLVILGEELKTAVRTPSKLAKLVELLEHEDAPLLAKFIMDNNLDQINDLVASRFKGEPTFDLNSPKQMRHFLYRMLGLPVRIVNATTPTERQNKPLLARVISDHRKQWAGHDTSPIPVTMLQAHLGGAVPVDTSDLIKGLLMTKAKTDDTAIDFALAMDVQEGSETARILKCIKVMKKCGTRENLFYRPYTNLRHWVDNRIHGQAGQCRTVTRRFAPNDPNTGQLPKKGEGVKFRECFTPHKRGAVVVSIDFSGQELRQGAGQSGDANMMACFVGENKKDMHSMTAAGAMLKKWGQPKCADLTLRFGVEGDDEYGLFNRLRRSDDPVIHKMADDLRKNAKNVNFGAQYDAQAPKLAETLIIPVVDAEAFLQAKYAMFPRFEKWKDEVKADASRLGYVTTPMGARRHLRDALLSEEWGAKDKALRQGPNFKIQGGSAEQTKLAMGRLWKSGILFSLDMVFFGPIHDELVWSVSAEDALASIKSVHRDMTQPYGNLPVPFLGSVSLGPNFGDQHECGDDAAEDPTLLDTTVPRVLGEIFNKEAVTA